MTGRYKLTKIKDYESFRYLKEDWNRLAQYDFSIYPFICYEWFDLWFKSFLKKALLNIYVLSDEGSICAIIPFIKSKFIFAKKIRLAVNDHSQKIEIISDKKDLDGYIETFIDTLLSEDVSIIYLEDLLEESASTKLILNYIKKNKHKCIYNKKFIRESVFINTSIGWDNLRATLSKKYLKNINYQKRKIYKAGKFQFIEFTRPEHFHLACEYMEEISSESWQGKNGTGIFSREDTRAFYTGLADVASQMGWLTIWILFLDSKPIAYEYHINTGEVDYALKAEYNRQYSELSPGSVLDTHVVKELSNRKVGKYDILGYKELYKTRWSNEVEKYVRIYIFKRNLIGKIYHFIEFQLRTQARKIPFLRMIKTSFKKLIKKSL